ncbi:surfeit locus 1 family protein [Caulobacter ginsengisoli]|uniref:SURF1-like protein n=1 Tax=Caulobacter ginsengisoli TaxID=400775 RepID=A0ABU0IXF6_9CAUL|nr:SURF1 family cytochrome oxidase biogenesis protein [Caulobacter ginsengisoli]MDQ0466670.1 surfeit locus 1 family protein [Caulobacter ginsengisoli]
MTSETSERGSRFPIGLTIATAIAMAILIGLGVWQLQRLAWKQNLLAQIAARSTAPAVSLDAGLASAENPEFTRVRVVCPGLATARFVAIYAIGEGQAGDRLVSLCHPTDSKLALLVDRGFVAGTISARPPQTESQTPVAIVGLLRRGDHGNAFTPPPQDGRFFSRDLAAIGKALGATRPLAPLMLSAETSSNPEWKALVPAPLPSDIPNRHLEYALTWFGLAGALAAVYGAMLWRRRKA